MPFEISITRDFSASHQLRMYDGALEPLHGHNWHVIVTVGAAGLDSIGVVMDFHLLGRNVDAIVAPLHNQHLNETMLLNKTNPSAENVAAAFATALRLPDGVELRSVEVWETPDCRARWLKS